MMPTTPPRSAMRRRASSSRFRHLGPSAATPVWEQKMRASRCSSSAASSRREACARSTASPCAAMASSTRAPRAVRPRRPRKGNDEPPSSLGTRWVRPMKATPRRASSPTRSTRPSIACPPSMPRTQATLPSGPGARSAGVRASTAAPSSQARVSRLIWNRARVQGLRTASRGQPWARASAGKPPMKGNPRETTVNTCSRTPASPSRTKSTCPRRCRVRRSRFQSSASAWASAT